MLKTLRFLILAAFMVSGMICVAGPAIAAGTPGITGNTVNGTSGGPVSGLEITLTTYVSDMPSRTQTAVTDDQGNYQFVGLSTNASYSYDLNANYKGVQYTSDIIQLTAINPIRSANLTVYETTNSDAAIQISNGNMTIIPMDPGVLNVMEVWVFNNTGDKIYTGGEGNITARFTLPSGAIDFIANPGVTADNVTGTVTDMLPIFPGRSSMGFTYRLLYQGNDAAISRNMDYATPSFSILTRQGGITANSTTLIQSTAQTIQGTPYINFTGSDLKSGQKIDIRLTIAPAAFPTPASPNTTIMNRVLWQWIIVGALALGLVFAAVYRWRKSRRLNDVR